MATKGTRPKPSVRKGEQDFNTLSSKEKGLVSLAYRKNIKIRTLEAGNGELLAHFLNMALLLPKDIATERIWDYISTTSQYWHGDSTLLDIKTTIGDYTNQKGVVSKAHYTINGQYFKAAKKDDTPEYYTGNFAVSRDQFNLDWTKIEKLVLGFTPKTLAERNEYKATAATAGVKRAKLSGVITERKRAKPVSLDDDEDSDDEDSEEIDCDSE
jgi:hypothetical protein